MAHDFSGRSSGKFPGTTERLKRWSCFSGRNVPNGNSCTICANLIFDTSFRLSFLSQQQLIRELNGKENVTFEMTSQSLKLLGDYSDSFSLSNAVELSRS